VPSFFTSRHIALLVRETRSRSLRGSPTARSSTSTTPARTSIGATTETTALATAALHAAPGLELARLTLALLLALLDVESVGSEDNGVRCGGGGEAGWGREFDEGAVLLCFID